MTPRIYVKTHNSFLNPYQHLANSAYNNQTSNSYIMKVCSFVVLALTKTYSVKAEITEENGVTIHNFGRHPNLQVEYVNNKISWPECVDLKMTV